MARWLLLAAALGVGLILAVLTIQLTGRWQAVAGGRHRARCLIGAAPGGDAGVTRKRPVRQARAPQA